MSQNNKITGGRPPKASTNSQNPPSPPTEHKNQSGLISTYPLLRQILQSRQLLSDHHHHQSLMEQKRSFNVEVSSPHLKYELLDYLVREDAQTRNGGRVKDFDEVGMILLSKNENNKSNTSPVNYQQVGRQRIQFKRCRMHNGEELIMYDRINKVLLCCRCLAMIQLKPDNHDTKEIVMADDYCLKWMIKWRELSQRVKSLQESYTQRCSTNGLLYTQIQNHVVGELLKKSNTHVPIRTKQYPLAITEFAQRIFEAENLIQSYEVSGSADLVHEMELAHHLFSIDCNRLEAVARDSELMREDILVETIGRYLACQILQLSPDQDEQKADTFQTKGPESMFATMDEIPNPNEVDECDLDRKRPSSPKKKVTLNVTYNPPQTKNISLQTPKAQSSMKKQLQQEEDTNFWDCTQPKQQKENPQQIFGLLQTLSSLRLSLRQACSLSETLKQQALQAELQGDAFKALELMSETHATVVKIRSLEQRLEVAKKAVIDAQDKQAQEKNQAIFNHSQSRNKNKTTKMRLSSSQSKPFKHLRNLL